MGSISRLWRVIYLLQNRVIIRGISLLNFGFDCIVELVIQCCFLVARLLHSSLLTTAISTCINYIYFCCASFIYNQPCSILSRSGNMFLLFAWEIYEHLYELWPDVSIHEGNKEKISHPLNLYLMPSLLFYNCDLYIMNYNNTIICSRDSFNSHTFSHLNNSQLFDQITHNQIQEYINNEINISVVHWKI